jgi:hypothetical protein
MVVKADDIELDVIDSVLESVGAALGHEPSWSCAEFVRQYFHWVPAQDLRERDPVGLAGAVLGHWEQMGRRHPREAKVAGTGTAVARPPPWSRSSATTCRSSSTR